MISIAAPFGCVGSLELTFKNKYESWLILGAKHEAVYECYSIEPGLGEFDFGLGVAVAVRGATPKVLLPKKHHVLFVGFDSFLARVPITTLSSATIEHQLLKLDSVFVDMVLLQDETICIIHELGALLITENLTKLWSISTDIISDWTINETQTTLSLTEADSNTIKRFVVSTGTALKS